MEGYEEYGGLGSAVDVDMHLTKNGSTAIGTEWTTNLVQDVGNEQVYPPTWSDLRGVSWTAAEINASGFGALIVRDAGFLANNTTHIDHVEMRVHWTATEVSASGQIIMISGD